MNQLLDDYNVLKQEVSDYQASILEIAKSNAVVKDVYKGCQILFSPLKHNPDFLFFGINPGAGFFNFNKTLVNKLEPQEVLEYLDENEDYSLQRDTLKVFEMAGKSNILINALKTNHCYFATQNAKTLGMLTSQLYKEGLEPWEEFNKWSERLIHMIKPKILFCEGFSAFDSACKALGADKKKAIVTNEKIKSLCVNDFKIIGYKRGSFGQVLNKSDLAKFLSEELP